MATQTRFRPVVFGTPPTDGFVYYLQEIPGGLIFQTAEFPWEVAATLEDVQVSDLLEYYQPWAAHIRILPIRIATGEDSLAAQDDLLNQIVMLARHGVSSP